METFKTRGEMVAAANTGNADALYLLGKEEINNGRIKKGFDLIKSSASKGVGLAKVEMGRLLLTPFGDKNVNDAEEWFKEAELCNEPEIFFELGKIFLHGENIEFDIQRAKNYFEKAILLGKTEYSTYLEFVNQNYDLLIAANNGNVDSQYEIGEKYLNEWKNSYEDNLSDVGVRWLKLAANNHYRDAMYELGRCYQDGSVVERNLEESLVWYEKAWNAGHSNALEKIHKINEIHIVPFLNSFGTIYDGNLYYSIPTMARASSLLGVKNYIDLNSVTEIRYQKEKHNVVLCYSDKQSKFTFFYNYENDTTAYGDDFINRLCADYNFENTSVEKNNLWYDVLYLLSSLIYYYRLVFRRKFINSSKPTKPGHSRIFIYTK